MTDVAELRPAHLGEVRPPAPLTGSHLFQKGRAKTAGRRKGTLNKDRNVTLRRIEKSCDPIGFLCRIVNGEAVEVAPAAGVVEAVLMRPTMQDRLFAARTLANKLLPDLQATKFDGDATPVTVNLLLATGIKVTTGEPA